ncbi:transferase [Streptomyces albidoflavus]|nr:transferase [Streptomyces albidoflavus]
MGMRRGLRVGRPLGRRHRQRPPRRSPVRPGHLAGVRRRAVRARRPPGHRRGADRGGPGRPAGPGLGGVAVLREAVRAGRAGAHRRTGGHAHLGGGPVPGAGRGGGPVPAEREDRRARPGLARRRRAARPAARFRLRPRRGLMDSTGERFPTSGLNTASFVAQDDDEANPCRTRPVLLPGQADTTPCAGKDGTAPPMRISFLIHNAYGIGGTVRATHNLAAGLAEQHEVEIVSVFRHREKPFLDHHPRVTLRHLVDTRTGTTGYEGDHPEHAIAAEDFPREDRRYHAYSMLTDRRIRAHLGASGADVVVTTRPGLTHHLARQGAAGAVRVGQEHLGLDAHTPALRRRLRTVYPRLDALTTATEADARAHCGRLRLPGVHVAVLPNAVPAPAGPPADPAARRIVAAGRLVPVKRYELLIRAFARVHALHPEWSLDICGDGERRAALAELVDELGLTGHVRLRGAVNPMEEAWTGGSVAAVTSRWESFGMTVVEAMRCGVPVVAVDCPHGPREIITDGVDGLLVRSAGPDALAEALLSLVGDENLRHSMGRAALASAARYSPAAVAERCSDLFTSLAARRGRSGAAARLRGSAHRARGAALSTAFALRDTGRAVGAALAPGGAT